MAMNSEHWPPDISGLNEAKALSRAAFQTMMSIVKFLIKLFNKSMDFKKKAVWFMAKNIKFLKEVSIQLEKSQADKK